MSSFSHLGKQQQQEKHRDMKIKRHAKWLLCCQLTLAFAICMLLRKDDSFSLLLLPLALLSGVFCTENYEIMSQVTTRCQPQKSRVPLLACVLCTGFLRDFSFISFGFRSRNFFFKLDIFKRQRARTFHVEWQHTGHIRNNNTCICSFGSHARTVIIMWWFHNIFKLAHTKSWA